MSGNFANVKYADGYNLCYNKLMDSITEQILVHLYNCIDYGFSYRAKKMFWIDDLFTDGRKRFSKEEINSGIKNLKRSNV